MCRGLGFGCRMFLDLIHFQLDLRMSKQISNNVLSLPPPPDMSLSFFPPALPSPTRPAS